MLLILKTNDLIRGIEHTLKTNKRMGAFRVMSTCCVRSIYGDRIYNAKNRFDRVVITLAQYWQLFKINLFYTLLNLGSIYGHMRRNWRFTFGTSIVAKEL